MMTPKAVLFDLDGTLADTALDLGGALNQLLRQHHLPEKSMDEVRPIASHGAAALLQLGMNITREDANFHQLRQAYLNEYEQCFDQKTVLFDDISELITVLNQQGITWGIITNKPQTFTQRLVPKLHFPTPPAVVVSGDTCPHAKPHPEPMLYACQQLQISPEQCWYIGDAERDMQAGKAVGMTTVLAEWGYISDQDPIEQWPFDYRIAQPLQLLTLLSSFQA